MKDEECDLHDNHSKIDINRLAEKLSLSGISFVREGLGPAADADFDRTFVCDAISVQFRRFDVSPWPGLCPCTYSRMDDDDALDQWKIPDHYWGTGDVLLAPYCCHCHCHLS